MKFAIFRRITLPAVTVLLLSTVTAHAQLSQQALAGLETLRLSPESAGTLIYRGATFAQTVPAGSPLYHYERRALATSSGFVASHLTRDPSGRLIIAESSVLSPNYEVRQFDVANQQSGFAGSVKVSQDGHHLEYELNTNGVVTKASEDVSDPVVSGPSLFGFILKHWDPLKAGATIPVRFIVMKEKTSYGFDLKFEKLVNGQASFTITPSSLWLRLAVAPMRVVFDENARNVVRYEGRVPPMENVSGKLKDLDARVEYTSISATYR